jgi:hypothetical protein
MPKGGTNRLIAEWSEQPFTSIKRRRVTVEHRILADTFPGVGCDIRHEVRCEEYGPEDGWTTAEVYEVRQHGVDRVEADERWWSA